MSTKIDTAIIHVVENIAEFLVKARNRLVMVDISNLRRCAFLLALSACRLRNTSSRQGSVKIKIAYPAYSRQERINTKDSENCPANVVPAAALYAYCDLRNMGPVSIGCTAARWERQAKYNVFRLRGDAGTETRGGSV